MSLICVDTQILIWGVRREATAGQEDMIGKAVRYFEHLDTNKDTILVPTIVLSEFLVHIPKKSTGAVLGALQRRFMIAPFDAPAAAIAADIWREKLDTVRAMKQDGVIHATIKADVHILATALARNASCIVTYDSWLVKLAEGRLSASEMPKLASQTELGLGAQASSDAPSDGASLGESGVR